MRLASADRLDGSDSLAGREPAVHLALYSASLLERLADKRQETGGDPLPEWEPAARVATRVAPANPPVRAAGAARGTGWGLPPGGSETLASRGTEPLYQPRLPAGP